MRTTLLLFLILLFTSYTFAQDSTKSSPAVVKGFVKNKDGKFIEGANVVIEGTIDGATSDDKGYYEFETEKTGERTIICSALDFGEKKFKVQIQAGETLVLDINLSKTDFKTEEISVTASSFTSGENSRVTLTPLEITRIPGANADLYRAITTFPGSNQVDEGSRIAVRGGDPSEVLTILDGASLYNPFVFSDDYNTSSFSTVNPWGMRGINFSSGGFPARFGNVLSAVLDLQTYDVPTTSGMFLVLGLANADISGVYSKNGKFGASFSASTSFIKPFLKLNNIDQDYNPAPTTSNLGGTVTYKTSKTGLLKVYANYSYDNVGVRNTSPTYDGYYTGESKNFFTNVKYSFAPTTVSLLSTSVSYSIYNRKEGYGVLNDVSDNVYSKVRTDFSTPVSQVVDFGAGLEYEYNGYDVDGTFPIYTYFLSLNAPSIKLNANKNNGRVGSYVEGKYKPSSDFLLVAGLRNDYYTLSSKDVTDPRLSVVYRLTKNSFIKGATGIYHQNPALQYFVQGNTTDIKPEQAVHYILGYEYNRDNDYILRVESYYKDYTNLISYDPYSYLTASIGTGTAKGVDVFLKVRLKPKFNGWISYAYTDSKRKQFDAANQTPADYDITHSLSVVATYNVTDRVTVGASYKVSTGKPYTPVTGSMFDPNNNVYIPIYADRNSGRFPTYQRVDLNAQYIFALFGRFAVAFFALNNLLNTSNLYQYSYNFDYSQRININSGNKRIIYFGMGLQL
jgi:hypothetical protein